MTTPEFTTKGTTIHQCSTCKIKPQRIVYESTKTKVTDKIVPEWLSQTYVYKAIPYNFRTIMQHFQTLSIIVNLITITLLVYNSKYVQAYTTHNLTQVYHNVNNQTPFNNISAKWGGITITFNTSLNRNIIQLINASYAATSKVRTTNQNLIAQNNVSKVKQQQLHSCRHVLIKKGVPGPAPNPPQLSRQYLTYTQSTT
eukprot:gene2816-1801_t